eukprot:TRINITY_DN30970_c0_g1_i1.p1 TRINITY_DN30970_c0_g1~~TRINITY_DN30970_c0_g1_i1.p1  ORF type:complete len:246 (-),score=23.71 TRINITY_DN30970_c0_g1_i1:26-763(-)
MAIVHPRKLLLQFQAREPHCLQPDGSGYICHLPPCGEKSRRGLQATLARAVVAAAPASATAALASAAGDAVVPVANETTPATRTLLPDATSALTHLVDCHLVALEKALPGLNPSQLPSAVRALYIERKTKPSDSASRDEKANVQAVATATSADCAANAKGEIIVQSHTVSAEIADPPGFETFITSAKDKLDSDLADDGIEALRELARAAADVGPARQALLALLEAGVPCITRRTVLAASEALSAG